MNDKLEPPVKDDTDENRLLYPNILSWITEFNARKKAKHLLMLNDDNRFVGPWFAPTRGPLLGFIDSTDNFSWHCVELSKWKTGKNLPRSLFYDLEHMRLTLQVKSCQKDVRYAKSALKSAERGLAKALRDRNNHKRKS